MGHLPLELSRVVKHLIDRGAVIYARITNTRYRRSPLVQGGLEIPCIVTVTVNSSFNELIWNRFKELVEELYEEPVENENINKPTGSQLKLTPTSSTPSTSRHLKFPKVNPSKLGIMQFCKPMERFTSESDDKPKSKRVRIVLTSDEESD